MLAEVVVIMNENENNSSTFDNAKSDFEAPPGLDHVQERRQSSANAQSFNRSGGVYCRVNIQYTSCLHLPCFFHPG